MIIPEMIFWLCGFGLFHTYMFYPIILRFLAAGKQNNAVQYTPEDAWPLVSVIMSLYNEEHVIKDKLDCLLALNYPKDRIRFFIGSDCSEDQTNEVVSAYAKQHPQIHFYPFSQRRGKPGVINELSDIALASNTSGAEHIFVVTDANVMPQEDTFLHLMKHFKNEEIIIVDSNMIHVGMQKEGISKSEDRYISGEVMMKHREGIVWGKMIGPFGGCYAIRSEFFSKVPSNFLVDDFYIAMKVFERGGKAINDLDAVCLENVSHEIHEEFRRKARISAGNFQNLFTFTRLWFPSFRAVNFAFFSHKVLRWLGPLLMIGMLVTNCVLLFTAQWFYQWTMLALFTFIFVVPALDRLLQSFGQNNFLFRSIRYFVVMNWALLKGFIRFLKGIQTNIWQPPKRS
ncbi:MAG: glycosyltransferase [Saprospiraceae bacterium]|nr:glycosyltransferase [Saprospiraceae bacterium]